MNEDTVETFPQHKTKITQSERILAPAKHVHFSAVGPVVICLPRISYGIRACPAGADPMEAVAVHFSAQVEDKSIAVEGDTLSISKQEARDDEWWKYRNMKSDEGVIPKLSRSHRSGSLVCSVHKTRKRGRCSRPSAGRRSCVKRRKSTSAYRVQSRTRTRGRGS
ncbi:hypothetical protein EDB85DRAFT_970603 [Lactarius pseudohatsudake]|nr:hypothetical protein EDB85DRAFT_970603 [Lactarius pseudohatsudake]